MKTMLIKSQEYLNLYHRSLSLLFNLSQFLLLKFLLILLMLMIMPILVSIPLPISEDPNLKMLIQIALSLAMCIMIGLIFRLRITLHHGKEEKLMRSLKVWKEFMKLIVATSHSRNQETTDDQLIYLSLLTDLIL